MSTDIEECLGYIKALGQRLKKEQHDLVSVQNDVEYLLQVVQATLGLSPTDPDRQMGGGGLPSTFFNHQIGSVNDMAIEGRSKSVTGSVITGRFPSASSYALLDHSLLTNVAGMLDMSVEDALNKAETHGFQADQEMSMKKGSTGSLARVFRFGRTSHSRRQSTNFEAERQEKIPYSTSSSRAHSIREADRLEPDVLQARFLDKPEMSSKTDGGNNTSTLSRSRRQFGESGPHIEIDVRDDRSDAAVVSDTVQRRPKSRAQSIAEQRFFDSESVLRLKHDSNEGDGSQDRHAIPKELARLKTTGGAESNRSNSVVSVKFHTYGNNTIPPSANESQISVRRQQSKKEQESVISASTAGVSSYGGAISGLRSFIVQFLYLPSFTEFGFNVPQERGWLKSRASLISKELPGLEGFHPFSLGISYWGVVMFYGVVEPSIAHARWLYLRTGLLLDVLCSIPLDIITAGTLKYAEALLLIRLLYTRNIGGIIQTNAYLMKCSRWIQKTFGIGVSFMRIFLLGGMLITFLHIHGCIVFFLGKVTGFPGESWRKVQYLFNETVSHQYIWSLFVATANTFPVTGFQPTDPYEQVIGIILALVGAVLYACLVGTISSFSFGLDSSGRKYREKIDEVNEYMTYRNLSDGIKKKVRDYFDLKYKGKFFDEEAILKEMNDSLRLEIAVHNCQDLIAKVPFLRREMNDGRDEVFMGRIARALKPKYFVKGDIIFEQGWVGNEMYFILNGSVSIIVNGRVVGQLSDGAFFGEVALLGEVPRTATIRSSTNTVLYCLDRHDFLTIIADYQDMAVRIKQVYEERMVKVKKENEEKLVSQQTETAKSQQPPLSPR
ncbi:hypothetical protein HDU96_002103 [Phlyctochytrium bullatum]|nr:hypothetical protein HDU96_002103 [Phlyctochytrium bullatum]